MEVRRNTRTSAPAGRATFTRPSTLDVTPLQRGIQSLGDNIDAGIKAHQQFELQKRLLEENNKIKAEFEERSRAPDMDPFTFSQSIDADYTDRANSVADEYRKLGYDRELVNDFMLGMGRIRNGVTDNATAVQTQALATRALSYIGIIADEGSKAIVNDVDSYEATLAFSLDTVDLNPALGDAEKVMQKDAIRERFRQAGGEVLVRTRPEFVAEQLDPDRKFRSARAVAAAGPTGVGGTVAAEGQQKDVGDVLTQGGLASHVVAGFLGNFDVEGGYGGALGDGGTASGIAQWRHERRDNFKKQFGKEPHQATHAEQAQFVLWEMENPAAAGMSVKQRDAILNAGSATEAAELIDKYYERSSGAHRARRIEAAAKYINIGQQVPQAGDVTAVDIPPSDPAINNPTPGNGEVVPEEAPVAAAELHPVLRDLTGEERLRVLGMAYKELQQKTTNGKAEMALRLQNIEAQIESADGNLTLPMPTMDELLRSGYGEVAAGQIMARIETLQQSAIFRQDWAGSSIASIDAELEKLRPAQDDPALAVKLGIYQNAKTVRNAIVEKRMEDPAAYAISQNKALGEAVASGDSPAYYTLQRAEQTRLGIPKSQQNPWPQEYIDEQKEKYKTLSVEHRFEWQMRHVKGATKDEYANFVQDFEGTDAYDDALVTNYLWWTRPQKEINRLLPIILQGAAIIKNDPARRPPSEKMVVEFQSNLLGGVRNTNPNLSRSIRNAADAIYVSRGGDPVDPDTTLYTESLREAVGGRFGNASTGWGNYGKNGVRDLTIFPPLVTKNQWENWQAGLTTKGLQLLSQNGAPRYATGEAVSASDVVNEGVLVMVEPNVYTVKFRQSGGVTEGAYGNDGRPVLFRITGKDIIDIPSPIMPSIKIAPPRGAKY